MLDLKRTQELLIEARVDLAQYDELRTNTIEWISTLEKRLKLLGGDSKAILLPGVENAMKSTNPPTKNGQTNTQIFLEVLETSKTPLKAKEVWQLAYRRGAKSNSTHPDRSTDSILRDLLSQGKIEKPGPGKYQAKRAQEAP
jgi:hypothetical protein